jgi:hypothetical protein
MKVNYKYRQFLFFLIKLAIVVGAFYFIYQKTIHNQTIALSEFILQLEHHFSDNYLVILWLFGFTFFNWFFEILKWQTLVSSIKKITFLEATKQSLGSLTASLFTPNRIGEYGAKAIYFYKNDRRKIVLLNLISNVSQMTTTVLFGICGLLFLVLNFEVDFPILKSRRLIYFLVIIVISAFSGRFFISKKIRGFYWSKIILFIKGLSKKILIKTLAFSIIRYLIFSHQFYYLLLIFSVQIDYNTLMILIFAMYIIASLIPSLPMFDWLIKGSVAVFVFGKVDINELVIVSITSLMWLLNFALPAIFGSYFVINFKFLTKKNN